MLSRKDAEALERILFSVSLLLVFWMKSLNGYITQFFGRRNEKVI